MRDVTKESGDYIRGYSAAIEDARKAIAIVASFYPRDVFPGNSTSQDARSARVARLTCANIALELGGRDA
mgnify:CR=1 FL=1